MYSLVCLIHGDADGSVAATLAGLGAAVAPVLEGSFNGGDVSAHFTFADTGEHAALKDRIGAALAQADRADTALYRHGASGVSAPGLATGIHRTLLLRADHDATPARLERFAFEMERMAHYIPAIRNWRLSPVTEAGGELGWTHVWEQEYDSIDGLLGPYMLHPYHWALIDRWFDPECPDWLVHPRLCHSFAAYGRSIIGAA